MMSDRHDPWPLSVEAEAWLRDQFAMVALRVVAQSASAESVRLTPKQAAEDAYELAEAMLAARTKRDIDLAYDPAFTCPHELGLPWPEALPFDRWTADDWRVRIREAAAPWRFVWRVNGHGTGSTGIAPTAEEAMVRACEEVIALRRSREDG